MRRGRRIITITAWLGAWALLPLSLWAEVRDPWQSFAALDAMMLDDPAAALEAIQKERDKLSAATHPQDWLVLTLLAAEAASSAEQNKRSQELALAAKPLAEKLQDRKALARTWLLLGTWFESQDETQDAEKHFELARDAVKSVDDPAERANILNRVAYFYNRQALWQQAVRLLTEAFALVDSGPRDSLYYDLRNNLGSVYARGDLRREQEGVAWMKEALQHFQSHQQRFMAGSILLNLGQYYGDLNQEADAMTAYEEGLKLVEGLKDQSIRAYLLAARGVQSLRSGRNVQGIADLKAAQDIFSQGDNRFMVGRIGIYRSDGLLQMGKPQDALMELEKAAQSFAGSRALYDKFLIQKRRVKLFRVLEQESKELAAYRVWEPLYGDFLEQQNADQAHRMSAEFDLERKDQLNRLLEVQNQNQAMALTQVEKERFYLRLGMAGGAILILLMTWGLWQGKQVRKQKQNLQEVLDSVQEGIVRISADKKIFGRYSLHLERILGRSDSLRGLDILDLLFPTPSEARAMTQAVLDAVLGEDTSAWEFNQSHLPEEIAYSSQTLQLFWRPHIDPYQRVAHLILVIRDITEQKAYELSLKREQEKKEARNRKAMELRKADFIRVERYLKKLEASAIVFASLNVSADRDQAAMRQLHTWKGEARTLGLGVIAQILHEMEDCLLARGEAGARAQITFPQLVATLWEQHEEYKAIAREYEEVSLAHHSHGLGSVVGELLPDLQSRLRQDGIAWQGIQVRDELSDWTIDQLDWVRTVLLHALSNSVDHGFLRAPSEFKHNARAFFEIIARIHDERMQLIVRDNGQGILWDKLQQLAHDKGLHDLDRDGLTELLFADGVSTASSASLSSGRGVGLAAIHEICQQCGGAVRLSDHPNQRGASLEAWIPRTSEIKRAG